MPTRLGNLFFGQLCSFRTKLLPDELSAQFKELVEPLFPLHIPDFEKGFIGFLDDKDYFCVRILQRHRSLFLPTARGHITPYRGGSKVTFRIKVNPIALVFLLLYLCFMVVVSIYLLYLTSVDEWVDLFLMAPILIIFFIWILMGIYLLNEVDQTERGLKALFKADLN